MAGRKREGRRWCVIMERRGEERVEKRDREWGEKLMRGGEIERGHEKTGGERKGEIERREGGGGRRQEGK